MLAKRIIPCLDVKDGRVVKGVQFVNLRDAGDPAECAQAYSDEGADELVFLDITATIESRETIRHIVESVAERVMIPLTVGGGIRTAADVEQMLHAGADKVSINTAAVKRPEVLTESARIFGAQCVVIAIDARRNAAGRWTVHVDAGRTPTGRDVVEWAREAEKRGAGTLAHLAEAFTEGRADAALAASIFHYGEHSIGQAKEFLKERGIPVRS